MCAVYVAELLRKFKYLRTNTIICARVECHWRSIYILYVIYFIRTQESKASIHIITIYRVVH